MKRKKSLLKSCLFLVACLLSAMAFTAGGKAEAAPAQVTMSVQQWNQFKQNTAQLEANLNLAAEKLKQQKSTSKELLMQLDEAQKQLRLTQEALISECQGIVEAQRGHIQDIDQENGIGEQEEPQG